ncbi:hypothetical protein GCM10020331_064350 [Ectobacillus funiculus]
MGNVSFSDVRFMKLYVYIQAAKYTQKIEAGCGVFFYNSILIKTKTTGRISRWKRGMYSFVS